MSYEAIERCEHCHGNGAEPGTPIETCERCGGSGQLQAVTRTPFGQMMRRVVCESCHGDGRVAATAVPRVSWTRSPSRGYAASRWTCPPGSPTASGSGSPRHGHAGEGGAPEGDLYVLVRVREDERFVREGHDLITALDVPAPLAALGGTLQTPTLDGAAAVEVSQGTQPGEVITLKGQGMPSLRGGRRGDLKVVVNVVVPRRLSEEQRELIGRLQETLTEENLRSEESMFAKLRRALRGHA